jgi:small subunit ribosomal protein S18
VAEDFDNEDELEVEEELEDELEEDENSSDHGGRSAFSRGSSSGRPSRSSSSRGRFSRRPRVCQFCADKTKPLTYKQTDVLRRFVTDQGKIRGRRETGTCAKHQRMVAKAVKRARHMALLSFAGESHR